jgi:Condensation domain
MRRRNPASLAQRETWLRERAGPVGSAHHLPLAIRLEGELDVRVLVDACEAAVARHPILGAAVQEHEGVPWLGPASVRPHVAHVDLSRSPAHRVAPQLADVVRRETVRPFDLGRGPLARFTLCRVGRGRFVLLVVAHRLVFDGPSADVLVHDLACLYGAFADGSPGSLPPLPPLREQVADEQRREAAALDAASEFWAARWREPDAVAVPGLVRPVTGTEPGGCVELPFDEDLDRELDRAARTLDAARSELLLAGLLALLRRWGNERMVAGVALDTRTPLTRHCVGPFANELPVAVGGAAGATFADLVAAARAELHAVHAVREIPLAGAVPAIGPRAAVAPVSMSYRRRPGDPCFPALDSVVEWTMPSHTARNALHLELVDGPEALCGSLRYATAALPPAAAARAACDYVALLRAASADSRRGCTEAGLIPGRGR